MAIKERRESDFVAILLDNQLIAYGRLTRIENKAFIGIGFKIKNKYIKKTLTGEAEFYYMECEAN